MSEARMNAGNPGPLVLHLVDQEGSNLTKHWKTELCFQRVLQIYQLCPPEEPLQEIHCSHPMPSGL